MHPYPDILVALFFGAMCIMLVNIFLKKKIDKLRITRRPKSFIRLVMFLVFFGLALFYLSNLTLSPAQTIGYSFTFLWITAGSLIWAYKSKWGGGKTVAASSIAFIAVIIILCACYSGGIKTINSQSFLLSSDQKVVVVFFKPTLL